MINKETIIKILSNYFFLCEKEIYIIANHTPTYRYPLINLERQGMIKSFKLSNVSRSLKYYCLSINQDKITSFIKDKGLKILIDEKKKNKGMVLKDLSDLKEEAEIKLKHLTPLFDIEPKGNRNGRKTTEFSRQFHHIKDRKERRRVRMKAYSRKNSKIRKAKRNYWKLISPEELLSLLSNAKNL